MPKRIDRIVIFTTICTTTAFLLLAFAVNSGFTEPFDRNILMLFRTASEPDNPIGPGWAEEVGRDITALGSITVLSILTLCISGFFLFGQRQKLAFLLLLTTCVALLMSTALKAAFDRARPELVPHSTRVYTASFPSAHAMHSAATFLTLGGIIALNQRQRRLKIYSLSVAVSITGIVGISRIYLGVHWPTDIAAGWAAGGACASIAVGLARRLQEQSESGHNDRV